MGRFIPYNLHLQISQMYQQGQSFFATAKVEDWLRQYQQDPAEYIISFTQYPAPPGSGLVYVVQVHLQRRDGQPVDPWLLAQLDGESRGR